MTTKLEIKILDKLGVWIDARKSNGGVPFANLPFLEGFPRELSYEETLSVEVTDFTEVIYIRDIRLTGKSANRLDFYYCIKCPHDNDVHKAYIYSLE